MLVFLCAAGAVFLYFHKPGEISWMPPCFFYEWTGFYCIGCGTGRMCYSLLHLDIVTAARCNILALIAVPLIGYTMLRYGIKIFTGCDKLPNPWYHPGFSRVLLFLLPAFWILRNIPIEPFIWLLLAFDKIKSCGIPFAAALFCQAWWPSATVSCSRNSREIHQIAASATIV